MANLLSEVCGRFLSVQQGWQREHTRSPAWKGLKYLTQNDFRYHWSSNNSSNSSNRYSVLSNNNNGGGKSDENSSNNVFTNIKNDMKEWAESKIWPLSAYCPNKEGKCLEGWFRYTFYEYWSVLQKHIYVVREFIIFRRRGILNDITLNSNCFPQNFS